MLARASLALHASRFVADAARRAGSRRATSSMSTSPGVSFGPISIPPEQIFLETSSSFALVNLKPVVPGHVLVCPRRVAQKFTDLTDAEIADLWQTVAIVQRALERAHATTSSTLAIQDGPLAGQTVPHVHVHVLPRREGDFSRNDDVYDALEGREALDDDRRPRSMEEMTEEANALRVLCNLA